MHTPKLTVVLYLALAGFLVGCTTTSTTNSGVDINRVARILGVTAETASFIHLRSHPEDRPRFEAARSALSGLDAVGDYSPIRFAEALQALPLRELKGPDGVLIVTGAMVLWEEANAQFGSVSTPEWVKPILQRVQGGIDNALAATAPPAVIAPSPTP